MLHTHKPMSDADIKAMRERIEARRDICKRVLGSAYICHPSQRIQRKDAIDLSFIELQMPDTLPQPKAWWFGC